ncbi:MAG: hypothetical protein GY851_28290 [bacterium]|nr:hypothetical protein [bacterium]
MTRCHNHEMAALLDSEISSEQAEQLETTLSEHPTDDRARAVLLGYCRRTAGEDEKALESYVYHALWVIRNRPASALAGTLTVCAVGTVNDEAAEEAVRLWQEHLDNAPLSLRIRWNANRFFRHRREFLETRYSDDERLSGDA